MAAAEGETFHALIVGLFFFRIEFPPCVQWFTIEFDSQCGTAQVEDYLLVSIPKTPMPVACNGQTSSISILEQSHCLLDDMAGDAIDGFSSFDSQNLGICKNARFSTSVDSYGRDRKACGDEDEWHVAQMFNKWVRWDKCNGRNIYLENRIRILGHRIGRRMLSFCLETKSHCRWKQPRTMHAINTQIHLASSA